MKKYCTVVRVLAHTQIQQDPAQAEEGPSHGDPGQRWLRRRQGLTSATVSSRSPSRSAPSSRPGRDDRRVSPSPRVTDTTVSPPDGAPRSSRVRLTRVSARSPVSVPGILNHVQWTVARAGQMRLPPPYFRQPQDLPYGQGRATRATQLNRVRCLSKKTNHPVSFHLLSHTSTDQSY